MFGDTFLTHDNFGFTNDINAIVSGQMEDGCPIWKSEECEMCLGGLHRCPKFAISYGNGKTNRHGQYKKPIHKNLGGNMADIAVITGASSGLGVNFLEAVVKRYPQMDEYWILARRKERLDKLAGKYKNKKVVAIEVDLSNESSFDGKSCSSSNS